MLGIYKCIIDLKRQKERVKENKRKFVIQKASVDCIIKRRAFAHNLYVLIFMFLHIDYVRCKTQKEWIYAY